MRPGPTRLEGVGRDLDVTAVAAWETGTETAAKQTYCTVLATRITPNLQKLNQKFSHALLRELLKSSLRASEKTFCFVKATIIPQTPICIVS